MKKHQDFLLEILTEEIPPQELKKLSEALRLGVEKRLEEQGLGHGEIQSFAAPRRLAVLVKKLVSQQRKKKIERQGPAVSSAFDESGKPTPAGLGFASSCGVSIDQLKKQKTEKGLFLVFKTEKKGLSVFLLLPQIIRQVVDKLPIARRMRWGDHPDLFVRPVHLVTMLYGRKIISTDILGVKTGNKTKGHRFHSKGEITIRTPRKYAQVLKRKGKIIVDFEMRKENIRKQLVKIAEKKGAKLSIEESLLDEVTAIVSWPQALLATFPSSFLKIPKEALISFMRKHQRCFPLFNENGDLLPFFITVSNIKSRKPKEVIKGNERVMLARLSDAKFFYETDKKIPQEERVIGLKNILFQTGLGSLFDKTQRLIRLTNWVAREVGANVLASERAAFLSKTDRLSDLVNEFPELQGIMGQHYAREQGEVDSVAIALREQYLPRHAGDCLPETKEGLALAIADRIDNLVGFFGINKKPTGDKDPFGLRRDAIGVVRIIVESIPSLSIDFLSLLMQAKTLYTDNVINPNVVEDVFGFVLERLRSLLIEKGFLSDEINAVAVNNIKDLSDFVLRVKAVKQFRQTPEAEKLTVANKRVTNLLAKEDISLLYQPINNDLLQEAVEIALVEMVNEKKESTKRWCQNQEYTKLLNELLSLCQPIDLFFDKVMVMVDDEKLRTNRLILLAKLKALFLQVADISLLQL